MSVLRLRDLRGSGSHTRAERHHSGAPRRLCPVRAGHHPLWGSASLFSVAPASRAPFPVSPLGALQKATWAQPVPVLLLCPSRRSFRHARGWLRADWPLSLLGVGFCVQSVTPGVSLGGRWGVTRASGGHSMQLRPWGFFSACSGYCRLRSICLPDKLQLSG